MRAPAPRGGHSDRSAADHRLSARVPARYDALTISEIAARVDAAATLLAYGLIDQVDLADAAFGALGHLGHVQLLLRAAAA
jgi:hypothetical protein